MQEELLTVDEVATRLKVSKTTIWRWLNDGKIKGAKINNDNWRIKESDLQLFIDLAFGEGLNGSTS